MKFEDKVRYLRIQKYKGIETPQFLSEVSKMTEGEPLEYLLGNVNFCNVDIDLSMRPMIPRPETEFWVKQALDSIIKNRKNSMRVLDLFSGSGNIGLAVLKNIPESFVEMIEFDLKLKEQIELSLAKNSISATRVKVISGNVWEGASGTYDVIFAVPPYVPSSMKEEVMKELHAENALSFFDKEDGYYYHNQVLSRVKEFMIPGGVLYLEFDMTQRKEIESMVKQYGFSAYSFLQDPYGHEGTLVVTL